MFNYIKESRDIALAEILRLVNEDNENYIEEITVEQKQKNKQEKNNEIK